MKRIITQNLNRNTLDSRRPSLEAKELGHLSRSIEINEMEKVEESKNEDDRDGEETLQSEIIESIEELKEGHRASGIFMRYTYNDKKQSMDLTDCTEAVTQTIASNSFEISSTGKMDILPSLNRKYNLIIENTEIMNIIQDNEDNKSVLSEESYKSGGSFRNPAENSRKEPFDSTSDPLKNFFFLVL